MAVSILSFCFPIGCVRSQLTALYANKFEFIVNSSKFYQILQFEIYHKRILKLSYHS